MQNNILNSSPSVYNIFINDFPPISQIESKHQSWYPVVVKQFEFSGGECHIKFNSVKGIKTMRIYALCQNAQHIMNILLTADALQRLGLKNIELFLPYIPYARQDRVMVDGEPLSIAVFARVLNSCKFKKVYVLDPHSDVAPALIKNVHVISNTAFRMNDIKDETYHKCFTPEGKRKYCKHMMFTNVGVLCGLKDKYLYCHVANFEPCPDFEPDPDESIEPN